MSIILKKVMEAKGSLSNKTAEDNDKGKPRALAALTESSASNLSLSQRDSAKNSPALSRKFLNSSMGNLKISIRNSNQNFGLKDLEILQTLGTGSFGRVHLSKLKESGKYAALKVFIAFTIGFKEIRCRKAKASRAYSEREKDFGKVRTSFSSYHGSFISG